MVRVVPCSRDLRRAPWGSRVNGASLAIIVDAAPTSVTNSRINGFPGSLHRPPAALVGALRRPVERQLPGLVPIFWHCTFTVKDKFKILFTTLEELFPFDDSTRKGPKWAERTRS